MSLDNKYKELITSYDCSDADWAQYVRDNLDTILASASWTELDPFTHNSMKYRLEDFLKDERLDPSIAWIVLIINQLGSNLDFIGLSRIKIPDIAVIRRLRSQYVSVRSNYNRARE